MIRLFASLVALSSMLVASGVEWVTIDGREVHPTRILVKSKEKPDAAKLNALPGVKVKRIYSQIPRLAALELKEDGAAKAAFAADPAATLKKTIADLKATGLFEYVEPDFVVKTDLTPNDRRFTDGTLWGLRNLTVPGADINAVNGWDITTGDANVVVAVIDTGVNYTHQDLATQMWVNPTEVPGNGVDDDGDGYVDNMFGINAILDNGDPRDDDGHGSHVAGTIGAAANNGFEHVGVAWKVRIMALKFLGVGGGATSDGIECINFAILKNVPISNNSWGGGGFSQALLDAILASRDAGHLFIAAAGNNGLDNDQFPFYPPNYDSDNIISVAALDRFDQLAGFSNYGATTVDIGAPGVEIFSCWYDSDSAYNTIQGTSMAAPHVAGAAVLVLSKNPTFSYREIRDRLLTKATKIPALTGKSTTEGRLNLFRSLSAGADGNLEITVTPGNGAYFLTNTVTNITIRVSDDLNVNNASVVGRFNGLTINFQNNGAPPDADPFDGIYTATVPMPSSAGFYDLNLSISAPGKFATNVVVTYEILVPPPNDDFEKAAKFPPAGGIKTGDNRLATTQAGEPLHAGRSNTRSLWWNWSTPVATNVLIDLAGTTFDDDAVLAVYTGSSLPGITEVASALATTNGPSGFRAPFVKFNAEANITYSIAVAQSGASALSPGQVTIRVAPNGEIDTTPPTVRVTNYLSGAFIRSANNTITLSGVAHDPPPNASGIKETGDGVRYKLSNDPNPPQGAIGSTNWSTLPIQLTRGFNEIQIQSFDRADNASSLLRFTIFYEEQELSNDLFANATSLTGTSGTITATNTTASKEFGEQAHAGNEGGHSLWWMFRPVTDGILVLNTEGSTFDTLLALYTVNNEETDRSVSSAVLVDQNDDLTGTTTGASELTVPVQSGKLYYVAVDGYGGQTGTIKLAYNFAAVSVVELTTSANPGGTISPSGTHDYPTGSAVTVTAIPERYKQFYSFEASGSGLPAEIKQNPFTFELTGTTTIRANFTNKEFAQDFEGGTIPEPPFEVSGTSSRKDWVVVTADTTTHGTSKVAAVNALPDGKTAALKLTDTFLASKGSFEFSINTEKDFDKFEFLLNGRVLGSWSGSVPWTVFEFDLPAGTSTLEWRYTKDLALTEGGEFVQIDNLDLQFAPAPDTFITINNGATPTLTVHGAANADYQLQSSTDLVTWGPASGANEATTDSSGTATFTLPTFSGAMRFYRVVKL